MRDEISGLLFRNVEIYGQGLGDCRVRDGFVAETGHGLRAQEDERMIRGHGGALLPGLADHHLHLAAMAAHEESLHVATLSREELAQAIASAVIRADGWVRAVGYDDGAHGVLDRDVLDGWNHDVPVRVQHRSGALWTVNSVGLNRLCAATAAHEGIELDDRGRLTGRLWRADNWLRAALDASPPSLRRLGARLASLGVTHVADATPDAGTAAVVVEAVEQSDLPQRVMLMAARIESLDHPRLCTGPVKLVVADHALPDLDVLAEHVRAAHAAQRPVAVHCVTRTALALTLAALRTAGPMDGDRIEHCSVADLSSGEEIAQRRIRVVTQPTLIARRGDDYWDRVEPTDRPDLWRYGSLLRVGVQAAPSSDAPYGDLDPWACLRGAADRMTPSGRVLGPEERVPPETTLRGMLSPLHDPGGPVRQIETGQPADLVLLDRPLADALRAPHADHVRATVIAGDVVHGTEHLD